MYKFKRNICPNYISTLFQQPSAKYELCNNDFVIPRFNTVTFGKHSLRYMGPKIWNIVPRKIRDLPTFDVFQVWYT